MAFDLEREIKIFRSHQGFRGPLGPIDLVGADILKFTPANPSPRRLRIGFLALIHGNEIVGLPVLNSILQELRENPAIATHEIYFGLGNLPAARANQRFLGKDLNRCFGQGLTATEEDRRAREIETHLLDHVDYLIDLHQTVHGTEKPFFIFQYSNPACFKHLALMNPGLTTILQFDAIGDSQSLSTDEYLRGRGKFGVALELGQKGWSEEMFLRGKNICTRFLETLGLADADSSANEKPEGRFYEISGTLKAPANESELLPNLRNFTYFEKDQVLGSSEAGPVLANESGYALFPKLNQKLQRGSNLFHVCRELSPDRLRELKGELADSKIREPQESIKTLP